MLTPATFPAATHPGAESSQDEPRRHRRWPLGVAAAALRLRASSEPEAARLRRALRRPGVPGTTVAGTDVSGKSREVVAAIERTKSTKVDISGDVTASATLADLGTTVDAQATADAVMARGDTLSEKLPRSGLQG